MFPSPLSILILPSQRRKTARKKGNCHGTAGCAGPLCESCKRLSTRACARVSYVRLLCSSSNNLYRPLFRILRLYSLHLLRRKLLVLHLGNTLNIVVVKDLRVPARWVRLEDRTREWHSVVATYIIIFQVSTGRSASLKLQSNFSSATGSSVGSWYGAR